MRRLLLTASALGLMAAPAHADGAATEKLQAVLATLPPALAPADAGPGPQITALALGTRGTATRNSVKAQELELLGKSLTKLAAQQGDALNAARLAEIPLAGGAPAASGAEAAACIAALVPDYVAGKDPVHLAPAFNHMLDCHVALVFAAQKASDYPDLISATEWVMALSRGRAAGTIAGVIDQRLQATADQISTLQSAIASEEAFIDAALKSPFLAKAEWNKADLMARPVAVAAGRSTSLRARACADARTAEDTDKPALLRCWSAEENRVDEDFAEMAALQVAAIDQSADRLIALRQRLAGLAAAASQVLIPWRDSFAPAS